MDRRRLVRPTLAVGLILVVAALILWIPHCPRASSVRGEGPAARAAAIRKLDRFGNEHLLIEALQDEDADVRILAAGRLAGLGPKGAERARALVRALGDRHAGVRREAAWSLGLIGQDALPPVRDALASEDPTVRAAAVLTIEMGLSHKGGGPWPARELESVAPVLRELLKDPDPQVRHNAGRAMKRLDWAVEWKAGPGPNKAK
jgi:HEAT repeat protein